MPALALRTHPEIAHAIKLRKAKAIKRGKKLLIRAPVLINPTHIERSYAGDFRSKFKSMYSIIERVLLLNLSSILKQGQRESGLTVDVFDDEFEAVMQSIRVEFARQLSDAEVMAIARKRGFEISSFNKSQNDKVLKRVLGVDVFRSEPWVQPQIAAFAKENVRLIKTLESNLLKDIEGTVLRGVRQGVSAKDVGRTIRERFGVTTSRAEFIARDQVQKLNGQMTRVRQTEIGVTRYIWRTARDERVRQEHEQREGEIFEWNDPPEDGHPGEPINCRCYAEPVLEDLTE